MKNSAMEASKWLKVQILVDPEEMQELFVALGSFAIYLTGAVTALGKSQLSHLDFLKTYSDYAKSLMEGFLPDLEASRVSFSSVFTTSEAMLNTISVGKDRQLMKVIKPVVQLQPHSLGYSEEDGKFRPAVFGTDSVTWGLQFTYPQLFLNPENKEVMPVVDSDFFPNTALFHALQKWIRRNTIPTPFVAKGIKTNTSLRIGKKCLPWINKHPQLIARKITVALS